MNNQKNGIKSFIFPTIGILTIVSLYFFVDFNSVYQSLKGEAEFITQDKSCNLHKGPCLIKIQNGTSFELNIKPKIELMKPLEFLVKSNDSNLTDLDLNIYSTNMSMGDFNFPLKNLGGGNYKAIGTLPTCILKQMHWNADIRIESLVDKTIGARFQFKTDK